MRQQKKRCTPVNIGLNARIKLSIKRLKNAKIIPMNAIPLKSTEAQVAPIVIPSWLIWIQSFAFAILYGIWAVPETIVIRHVCLILAD